MSSSDDNSIFLTQSTFRKSDPDELNTDGILSDVLDMEAPNFEIKTLFSDISDDDLKEVETVLNDTETRFCRPLEEKDLQKLMKTGLSKKTESKSLWGIRVFQEWQKRRNFQDGGLNEAVKKSILEISSESLNELLCFFIAEVRNVNGDEYRPNTLYELIIAIQHYIRQSGKFVSFLDDKCFEKMRNILDSKMKELSGKGLGIDKKKADIITEEQEEEMWSKGILGNDTPQKLLDTLLYQLGLHFALRAGQEHRNLRVGTFSQIKIMVDKKGQKYLEYHEDVSKTNRGGIKHRKLDPKVTRAYQNMANPERCPVLIYEKYISLRPKEGKSDALYLRPLRYPRNDCWYTDSPVGVHLLQKTVKKLCEAAEFQGNFTNHSLRATAATRLYMAGVDEQLITEKTGHRSNAVRSYKRTNDCQLKKVSAILQNTASAPDVQIASESSEKGEAKSGDKIRELQINTGEISLNLKF